MLLDRNTNSDGKGKYALINLRKINIDQNDIRGSISKAILENPEAIEFGEVNSPNEFFVIKLKDKYAGWALDGYADAAAFDKALEYSREIRELANRSGENNPFCKTPD